MLLPRLRAPARAAFASAQICQTHPSTLTSALDAIRISNVAVTSTILHSVRHASHQAQGRANGAKDGPGKRLGAKKSGEQYVIPGNIIFRQRGTHWFPGDNCDMGRDHTIYATQPGYVKYYRDPLKHPKRQYIGVVFQRHWTLPQPPNAARKRRLGMLAVKMEESESGQAVVADMQTGTGEEGNASGGEGLPSTIRGTHREQRLLAKTAAGPEKPVLSLRPGYMYRQANWEIGRAAERANVKVREFKPRDRYAAWRKTVARKTKNAERRGINRKAK
ncbi:54S ribosomal protein L2 mitochondrial [Cryomyces antarcticus]|uniref:Large ribosomal subunit protein bL27m n=1 Tax=Cryomyces antarcticus TaxID=329879 RepID=A0ABR0KTL1_9PEZI|nr:54S ribosomal protein L2 mitochondrial [Cryomyces antarcticus]KAK5159148.1 hypothetical protein LTR04_005044 [Oleoguttula sp. CCFEE 6159]